MHVYHNLAPKAHIKSRLNPNEAYRLSIAKKKLKEREIHMISDSQEILTPLIIESATLKQKYGLQKVMKDGATDTEEPVSPPKRYEQPKN